MLKMLTYRITTHFGEIDSFHPAPHTGVDFATPLGTQAQSISDGVVSKIANDPMLGESVRVVSSGSREWVYGHLSQVNVTYGQHVSQGDVLGLTGGVPGTPGVGHSNGAHLHLTLLQNGAPIDPLKVLSSPDGGSGWWHNLGSALTTPPYVPTATERMIDYLNSLIHIMPEVCGVLTMVFLLGGMVGSKRSMHWAGTSALLMFVGTILNVAIA